MEWIIALIVLMIMPLGMIFWWIPWQGGPKDTVRHYRVVRRGGVAGRFDGPSLMPKCTAT